MLWAVECTKGTTLGATYKPLGKLQSAAVVCWCTVCTCLQERPHEKPADLLTLTPSSVTESCPV